MIPTQRQVDMTAPADRVHYPKPFRLTTSERAAANEHKGELVLHDQFCSTLKRHNKIFGYVHANPRRKSTIRKGWPDFTVLCKIAFGHRPKNASCLIEFKMPGGRLSKDQLDCFGELSAAGIDVFVCTSLGDALAQLLEYFELPKEVFDHE